MKYIGDEVDLVLGMTPKVCSGEGSKAYGTAFDRLGCESAIFQVICGAVDNSPTNVLLTLGIDESDTEGGSYSSVTLTGTYTISGQAAVIPGNSLEYNMSLKGRKRWLRPNVMTNFTGGSSPTVITGVVVALGEARLQPV